MRRFLRGEGWGWEDVDAEFDCECREGPSVGSTRLRFRGDNKISCCIAAACFLAGLAMGSAVGEGGRESLRR